MIKLTLTATEYNEFVFDDVTQHTVAPELVGTALGLLLTLSDPAKTEQRPLTMAERQREQETGRRLWHGRQLVGLAQDFEFPDTQLKLMRHLLERSVARHPILVLPDFIALIERIDDALKKAAEEKEEDKGE